MRRPWVAVVLVAVVANVLVDGVDECVRLREPPVRVLGRMVYVDASDAV